MTRSEISTYVLSLFWQVLYGALLIAGAWMVSQLRRMQKKILHSLGSGADHLPLETVNRKDVEINIQLDRALQKFGSQRAYLSMFHNGDEFIDGSEIIRYSRTHERTQRGITYTIKSFSSVLTTSMPEEMRLVLESGAGWRVVDEIPDSRFKELCIGDGVRAVARTAVHHRDKIVGFVGLDFNDPCDAAAKPTNIEELSECAREIGYVLSRYAEIRDQRRAAREGLSGARF